MAQEQLTVTGNSQAEAEQSLRSAVNYAINATSDVVISFDLSFNEIQVADMISCENRNGKSITLDGAINGDDANRMVLKSVPGGNPNRPWMFRFLTANCTVKNLEMDLDQIHSIGINCTGNANGFSVKNCIIRNAKLVGVSFGVSDGFMEGTQVVDCSSGISVGKNFILGSNNMITGNNAPNSNGIKVLSGAKNVKLGLGTNDYENYSFIGGFASGIYCLSPFEMSDMILGGKKYNSDNFHSIQTNFYNTNNIRGINVRTDEFFVLGNSGVNPSVISTNCQLNHIYFSGCNNVKINNMAIGWSPFWTNGDLPSDERIAVHGLFVTGIGYEIGNAQGNTIENVNHGIRLNSNVNVEIQNNEIGAKNNATYIKPSKGVWSLGVTGLDVKDNTIGNATSIGVESRDNLDVEISGNFIGVSRTSESIFDTKRGVKIQSSENVLIERNYISSTAFDIDLSAPLNTKIKNNIFDAFNTQEPITTRPGSLKSIQVASRFQDLEIVGNKFIGNNYHAIVASNFNGSWTDANGVLNDLSRIKVYSNEIKNSTNVAILLYNNLDAEVGKEDEKSSGNEIINALMGIQSFTSGSGSKVRKIEICNNYIGESRSGEQGSIGSDGIFIGNTGNVNTHLIASNHVANTSRDGISLRFAEFVKLSKNRIVDYSGRAIKLNNANLIGGSNRNTPSLSGEFVSPHNYQLKNSTGYASYPNAKIEIFRQKEGEVGASEYVASVDADENWS